MLRFVTLLVFASTVTAQYFGGHGLGILPGGYGAHPGYRGSNLHFPGAQFSVYGNQGSRLGQGYVGNGGIGIKQSDANLADLYGLPRQLAQAPPPQPQNLGLPAAPVNPYLAGAAVPQYGQQYAGPYGPGLLNGAHFGGRGYLG